MAWETLRTVVESVQVSTNADEAAERFDRFPDAWEALKWLIARNPTPTGSVRRLVGSQEYRLYVSAGDKVAKTPDIWVVFAHNDSEIDIVGMSAVERAFSDDEE